MRVTLSPAASRGNSAKNLLFVRSDPFCSVHVRIQIVDADWRTPSNDQHIRYGHELNKRTETDLREELPLFLFWRPISDNASPLSSQVDLQPNPPLRRRQVDVVRRRDILDGQAE